MKKISRQLSITVLSAIVVFSSCSAGESTSNAEQTAKAFYTNLQKKDYTAAVNLCSKTAFAQSSMQEWKDAVTRNAGLLGEIKSFTRTNGFNISASTSKGTTVVITYDVQWEYGKSQDSVLLVKEKDGSMKIYRYTWLYKDPKFLTELNESEKGAKEYFDAIKSGNYELAAGLCSPEALKATPKEKWVAFLGKASDRYGQVTNYTVIEDSSAYNISSKGDAGVGNYYDIFIRSERGGDKVIEKIVFFQKDYNEPVKLMGHFFL